VNILDAIDDPKVFASFFKADTWDAWRVFLRVLFALPLSSEQLAIYQQHTGRSTPPTAPLRECFLVIGRRGGKSFMLACIAVFLAAFKDWRPFLGPGEAGTVMIVAADRRQARVIMRYCLGLLRAVPMLKQLIEAQTAESITLRNRVVLEIHTASFRSTRGYTIVAALLDELAYWPVDEFSAAPDVEVINAIRPGFATVPGSILLAASSPHARRGALWDAHTASISARMATLFWCGRRRRGR
jgi:phage terminase large subunit-like protein